MKLARQVSIEELLLKYEGNEWLEKSKQQW